jgi:hypothetical protein
MRGPLAVVLAVLGVIAGWRTFLDWRIASGLSFTLWPALTLALTLLAVWCAFADELWHLKRNHLAHLVGIGPWPSESSPVEYRWSGP